MDILRWAQGLVGPALYDSVARLPASVRRVADYHFAWTEGPGGPTAAGKALRPALTFLFAEAVGGQAEDAVAAAVAVELIHNFSLLHDDVMDGDAYRRHRPTAWTVFGVPQAILAGDALLTLAWQVLEKQDTALLPQLSSSLMALLEGQSSDVAFEERTRVSLDECRSMAAGKTGALIATACAFGAAAGMAPPDRVASAHRYGHHIGLAFQLVDDLLGIWGDPAITGKPVHADLAARKKSLPVVAALASSTTEADELAAMYECPDAWDGTALARAARLVEITGGRRWCEDQATEHVRSATDCLDALGLTGEHRASLLALAALVVSRDR